MKRLAFLAFFICLALTACNAPPGSGEGGRSGNPMAGHWVLSPKDSQLHCSSNPSFVGMGVGFRCMQNDGLWDGELILDIFRDHGLTGSTNTYVAVGDAAYSSTFGSATITRFRDAHTNDFPFHFVGFLNSLPKTASDSGYYGIFMPALPLFVTMRFSIHNPVISGNRLECDFDMEGYTNGKAVFVRQGPPQGKHSTFFRDDDQSDQDMNAIEAELQRAPSQAKVEQMIRVQRNYIFGVGNSSDSADCTSLNALFADERKMYGAALQPPPAVQPAPPAPAPSPTPSPAAPTSLHVQIGTINHWPPPLYSSGKPSPGYLGINPIDTPQGVTVANVVSHGPSLLYLHEGDAINTVCGVPIRSAAELRAAIATYHEGDIIPIAITRPANVVETLTITLGRHP